MELSATPEGLKDLNRLHGSARRDAVRALAKQEWDRCASDPLYWLYGDHIPYVYTLDHHILYRCDHCGVELPSNRRSTHPCESTFTELPPVRPFPFKPYIPPIVKTWQTEQLVLVEKSRDMMATWLFVALYAWDTFFHAGRQNFFQSKSAKDTTELVRRAKFIWAHQPRFLRPHKFVFLTGADSAGEFRSEALFSEIIGLPQGSDKVRQYHPTGIFTDETAFHPDAGETFAAIKPAIQAGGRYTGVSSAYPSWFMLACRDAF